MVSERVGDESGVQDAPGEGVNSGAREAPRGGQQAPSGGQGSVDDQSASGGQPAQQHDAAQRVPDGGQPAAGGPASGQATPNTAAPSSSGTGIDENVAGALSYLLGVITGVLFFVVDKDRPFVRFHAAQSIVVFGGFFVASIVLSVIGGIVSAIAFSGGVGGAIVGGLLSLVLLLVWLVVGFGAFVAWLYLMYKAYKGETPRVPIAARIADKLVN